MNHKIPKVLTVFAVVVLATLGLLLYLSPKQRLQRLGYSADEAENFVTVLDRGSVAELLARDYNADFASLLKTDDFRAENFIKYLNALAQNSLSLSQAVILVNHPDYEEGRTYSAAMLAVMQEANYLTSRRERYFNLLSQDGEAITDSRTIVALVNANRDYDFYAATLPTQTEDAYLMLVNKYYYLDETFVPDLVTIDAKYGAIGVQAERKAYDEFTRMANAALADGIQLYVTSGYRGYAEQNEVYNTWVQTVGEEQAPNYAALPGYSEHQTGLALDIFTLGETTNTFANCATAKWLAEHAPEFGFILRYGETSTELTGYDYEAWHFRYVGVEAATEITNQQLTLEEYWVLQHEK